MPETSGDVRKLGRYELLLLLGQGGMGEVHLARLSGAGGFEKLCIVKTILPQMKAEAQFVDRFMHEARVLTHLTHANIAQVYDMGDADGTLYMAIEYVPGVDLARVETRGADTGTFLPLPVALHIGRLMCEALGYAHRKTSPEGTPLGIVHRDVSPQNVMVSYEGEVKVIDFGLAKSAARSKHTLPATVMGKLGYMSPEQALAQTVDHRSDIYSAGIVIWEMIAGRPCFAGATMAEMVARMAMPNIASLRTIRPDVSETLDQVVMRSLQKDPALRYSRADEFARALNEVSVREGLTISAEEAGNFVRAMCPEEFAAERSLQSQLSLLRKGGQRPPSSPGHHLKPKSGTVSASDEIPLDGTFVRDTGSSPTVPLTPAQRALSVQRAPSSPGKPAPVAPAKVTSRSAQATARVAPIVAEQPMDDAPVVLPKRSPLPFVILGLVLLVAVAGGGYVVMGSSGSPKEPIAEPTKPVEPVKALEPVKLAEPVKDPVKPVEPIAAVDAGAAVEPPKVARVKVTPKGTLYKVIRRADGAFIDIGKGKGKLREGDRLRLVGEAVDGDQREAYGQARVLELKARGTVAELLMEEDDTHPEQLFAFVDETVVDRPKATKRPDEPIALADPFKKPDEPKGADPKPADPKPADPRPVEPKVAEVTPVEAKPVETKPAENALPRILGSVTFTRKKDVLFGNTTSTVRVMVKPGPAGASCDVHLPNGTHKLFGTLKPGDNHESDAASWARDPRPDPNRAQKWVLVECRDAAGYFEYSDLVKK
ncbi:MAG: protein kinase [Myxococcaceae bacterium]|nr:protein kinase [Myxococcaceae bacterium]